MKHHSTTVEVIEGDILEYPSASIVLPLDTGGLWLGGVHHLISFSGVNGSLQGQCGYWFHPQAAQRVLAQNGGPAVRDGQAILVDGASLPLATRGNFRYVIFVMDNLYHPLAQVVASGLDAAYAANLPSVSIPLIRSGVMSVISSFSIEELIEQTARGIWRAIEAHSSQPMRVTVLLRPDADTRWRALLPPALRLLEDRTVSAEQEPELGYRE